jgi:hypothetical protein
VDSLPAASNTIELTLEARDDDRLKVVQATRFLGPAPRR